MKKATLQPWIVGLTLALLAASALGYMLSPSSILSIVGIEGVPETEFLARTLAAAFIGLLPICLAVLRRAEGTSARLVLVGLAAYMFAGSAVDLHAYISGVVGSPAVPSIAARVVLGLVIVWLALP